jgi:hypothetical protein
LSTLHQPADTAPDTALLSRDWMTGYHWGCIHAYALGYDAGRRDEAAERDQAWDEIARPVAKGGPSHAELESRRWGPGGRDHFRDHRDGDFRGRGDAA